MNQKKEVLSVETTNDRDAADREMARQFLEAASTGHGIWSSLQFTGSLPDGCPI